MRGECFITAPVRKPIVCMKVTTNADEKVKTLNKYNYWYFILTLVLFNNTGNNDILLLKLNLIFGVIRR